MTGSPGTPAAGSPSGPISTGRGSCRSGRPAEVAEEVHRTFEACGTPAGGLIACGEIGPEVPLANVRAMYEAFRKYGRY